MDNLPALLAQAVERHGERIALVDGELHMTYADLWQRCRRFAALLRADGLQQGDRVAFALESSWQYVVACYGTLLAGGIAVPLNAAARPAELEQWSNHADTRWCLFGKAAFEELYQRDEGASTGDVHLTADDPACIHYTSGTTGDPKGVLLSHGNFVSNARAISGYLDLQAEDSILTILPFCYAYGSSVLHSHIAVGARVVIDRGFAFPHVVMQRAAAEKVTGFAGVPSTFALLLARVDLGQYDLSTLRYVTQAGGAMSPALVQRLQDALPGKRIFVMYGQTEATSRLSYLPPERLGEKLGSVGIAIPGVRLEVRDDTGSAVAPGQVGRVFARGPNVMTGYWRNPQATDRVLQDGWLDTGDVGYLDAEGYLYLSGRRTDIIKVGAHRVHPQDVENVIAELEEVAEVVVAGVEDPVLGEVIKAYVISREPGGLSELRVRRHCLEQLAAYKVPKHVALVSELPRTASGKIRRAVLEGEKTS